MNLYHLTIAVLASLYISYGLRLFNIFQYVWLGMDPEDKDIWNLFILSVTCIFWPISIPLCYLELISRS